MEAFHDFDCVHTLPRACSHPLYSRCRAPWRKTKVLTGAAAYGDWRADAPGVRRHIKASELPAPFATPSTRNGVSVVAKPAGARAQGSTGICDQAIRRRPEAAPHPARGAERRYFRRRNRRRPRARAAPNARRRRHRSATRYSRPASTGPFGIAFYPSGDNPQWVYVANTDSVVRFPYRNGDTECARRSRNDRCIASAGGHSTRDVVFSKDGNDDVRLGRFRLECRGGTGKAETPPRCKSGLPKSRSARVWGNEYERAAVLAFDPQGNNRRIFATGIRNCVGMAVEPSTGDLWCSTNERDLLGDDLVPDYITRVRDGAFYGWPWYYIGDNEDPRHKNAPARSQGQGHRAGYSDPAAFGLAAA